MIALLTENKIYSNVSHEMVLVAICQDQLLVCFFFVIFSLSKGCLEIRVQQPSGNKSHLT